MQLNKLLWWSAWSFLFFGPGFEGGIDGGAGVDIGKTGLFCFLRPSELSRRPGHDGHVWVPRRYLSFLSFGLWTVS